MLRKRDKYVYGRGNLRCIQNDWAKTNRNATALMFDRSQLLRARSTDGHSRVTWDSGRRGLAVPRLPTGTSRVAIWPSAAVFSSYCRSASRFLITGATFAERSWSAVTLASFGISFIASIAMWWIYFNVGADRASRLIEQSADPGRIARLAYTYLHVAIVAGIIVGAVGDEIVLKHPLGHNETASALILTGGPAIFLVGCLLFKWATAGWAPLSHLVGLALCAAMLAIASAVSPIVLSSLASLTLVIVAIWETVSLRASVREIELQSNSEPSD